MSISPTGGAEAAPPQDAAHGHAQGPLYKLAIGAIGIVYGDIGTSPIYAFRETFAGHHVLKVDQLHIFGVLSLIFWSMMIIVTLKYVTIIMRADNKGEGGSLALLALINRTLSGKKKWTSGVIMLGVFATALFYGDSMITPAVTVLSAVEGLETVNAGLTPFVIPIAIAILIGLFAIQARGTARVGLLFGPVMIVYFITLAVLGVMHIMDQPSVLLAMLNPLNAVYFFTTDFVRAFVALGSVVLAVTGAEALYADMGHFGIAPIRLSWFALVKPALLLCYLGQAAFVTSHPDQAGNSFYGMAPNDALTLALVVLATLATEIASQALINGAFSLARQAEQLRLLQR
ncbi:MAG: system potassium uptake protein, partial [Sphingomonadales bacterium]|nr:system potassium uptake protein [Sphingomonadales bacterium]